MFRELIDCELVPVTVLDQIFRQSKDSLIAYNAKFINEGNTKLYYGPDFMFMASDNQADAAERIISVIAERLRKAASTGCRYCRPSAQKVRRRRNSSMRQSVKWSTRFAPPKTRSKSASKFSGSMTVLCRPENTAKVSNGDLGFIRYIKDGENGKRVGLDFGVGRNWNIA